MATIQDLQRVFEDAPEHETSDVQKVEALRLLSPQILLMRSKGYSMAHIAGVLSERGVAVTAATLKSHLSRFKSAAAHKPRRTPSTPGAATTAASTPPRSPSVAARLPAASGTAAPTPSQPTVARAATETAKPPASSAPQEGAPRRSGFTVRPDTKDI